MGRERMPDSIGIAKLFREINIKYWEKSFWRSNRGINPGNFHSGIILLKDFCAK
jgi:hypothetical protein